LYKLAIFDFDGTLVDSAPGIIDVMRQVVDEYELHEDILTKWRDLVGVPLGKQMAGSRRSISCHLRWKNNRDLPALS
jgi:phosphoglycolate phosphatase-like HAD superfamily hydrolase